MTMRAGVVIAENVAGTFVARGASDVAGQAWAYLRSDLGATYFTKAGVGVELDDVVIVRR